MPDKWAQYAVTPSGDKWSQYAQPQEQPPISTQQLLEQGRQNINTPQGGAGYQSDITNFQAVKGILGKLGGMAKGGFEAADKALSNPQGFGEMVGSGVDAARATYKSTPQDFGSVGYQALRNALPMVPFPDEASGRAAAAMTGTNPDALGSAIQNLQPKKALVEATPLLAPAVAPEVARRFSGLPEALQTKMRGTVTANPEPSVNLAAAATEGGKPPNGLRLHEDIAVPATEDFRKAAADVGLNEQTAKGPDAHNLAVQASQKMVANAEAQARPILDAVRNQATNGIQNTIAAEIEKARPMTAEPSVNDAYGRLAERVRNAKTMGELLDIKSDLNKLSSSKAFGGITSDSVSSIDAAADAGDAIRRNLYPQISKLTGQDISPLMKSEQTAIRLQTQFEKAAPKLSTSQAQNETVSYGQRIRSGETLLDTTKNAIGVGKPTGYELFQSRLARTVKGAQPSQPPMQGPVQVFGGKTNTNPGIGPSNPGSGPMNPPASTGPVSSSPVLDRPNPGSGTPSIAGSLGPRKFVRANPAESPNPGQGPLNPPASLGVVNAQPLVDRPNPGKGNLTPAGSTQPQPNTGQPFKSPFGTPKMSDMVKGDGGGHAGNGVASLEEINRPGQNVSFSASGQPTFQGKSFAPESTPAGGVHATVFPDGTYRVNAGTMTPALENSIRRFITNYRK